MTDYVTLSFKTEEYVNSDLKIIHNSSSIHNEYILHGLILLMQIILMTLIHQNIQLLDVNNQTNNTIDVTTKDFKIINW